MAPILRQSRAGQVILDEGNALGSSMLALLRLPQFEVSEPESVQAAVELLAKHGSDARLMAQI